MAKPQPFAGDSRASGPLDRDAKFSHDQPKASMQELLNREHAARRQAEKAAGRIARLQAITASLAEALTPSQVVEIFLRQGLAALEAAAGSIVLLSDNHEFLHIAGAVGYHPDLLRQWQKFPLSTPMPLCDAVRTRRAIYVESPQQLATSYPAMVEPTVEPRRDDQSWAAIPLVVEGRALGAMGLNFSNANPFSDEDRSFMLALARQCAQALERARLYDAERSARAEAEAAQQRLEFLAEASSVLARSLDYETTLSAVAQLVVPRLADWCTVDMLAPDGSIRRLALAHADPAKVDWARELQQRYPLDPSASNGVPKVLRTGEPEFYPAISDELLLRSAVDEDHLKQLRTVGVSSAMLVPLQARGRVFGVLSMVTAGSARRYDLTDLAFAEDLGRRIAQAVDNSMLYREARGAVRSKDQAVALLNTLLASAPVGLAFLDKDLRMTRINDAMAALSGLSESHHLGKTLSEISPALAHRIAPDLNRVMQTGMPLLNVELSALELTGDENRSIHRDFLVSYYPVHAPAGELLGVGAIFNDITGRKQVEEQLKAAKDAAEQANAAKDQFLAVLSHELRTPLTPVLATLSILEQAGVAEPLKEDLSTIRRNVELEARLIDDLLDLTRIERGKLELHFEPIDAHDVICRTLEICRENVRSKQLRVELRLHAQDIHVRADSARLQQVLWNLVNNAVKFTPAGGRISISSHNPRPNCLRIVVTDTGIGIDAETMPRLFKAFEQGERLITRRYGGLGLGLTISKKLIDAHQGTLSVNSAGKNQGSTFAIELPNVAAPAARPADEPGGGAQAPTPEADLPSLEILLVEDHADSARILARLLNAVGHKVVVASSVSEALALARLRTIPFGLVISDIGLPDASGLDLMRQLRESFPHLPGIALSGFGMDADIARSREAGFTAHLTKPVTYPALEKAIAQVMRAAGA